MHDGYFSTRKCLIIFGSSLQISIPLGNVQAIEMDTMAFTEAIKVRVMENEEHTVDDEVSHCSRTVHGKSQ